MIRPDMSRGGIARNTAWNLMGLGLPLLAAVFAIPVLVRHLGPDRFGVLSLAWVGIGYFSLFDLGLGRALTKLVAEKLGAGLPEEVPSLVGTALCLLTLLGLAGTVAGCLFSSWIVGHVLKIPAGLQEESLWAFYVLSLSVPVVIVTTGLRGVLEAKQEFAVANAIRIPMGLFTFLGPLAVLPFSKSLFPIVIVLVGGRLVFGLVYFLSCRRILPGLRDGFVFRNEMVPTLFRFGGWMTVSNVLSPLMVSMDRFLIGALVSVTAVAYYSTPWEVVTKVLIVPTALVGVLFPAFSHAYASDRPQAATIYRKGVRLVFILMFPLTLVIAAFSREGLSLWLSPEFAENGYRSAQLLAVGMMVNGVAAVPFALLQGIGRPDLTAKFHFVELLVYLPAAYLLIKAYGINGAAAAWGIRASIDAAFLLLLSRRLLPPSRMSPWPAFAAVLLAASSLAVVVMVSSVLVRSVLASMSLLVFLGFAAYSLLHRKGFAGNAKYV